MYKNLSSDIQVIYNMTKGEAEALIDCAISNNALEKLYDIIEMKKTLKAERGNYYV